MHIRNRPLVVVLSALTLISAGALALDSAQAQDPSPGTDVAVCDNYVEQNSFTRPLGPTEDSYASTKVKIQGVAMRCHGLPGYEEFDRLRSASFKTTGQGPAFNRVFLAGPEPQSCLKTYQPLTQVTFTWLTGEKTVIQFEQEVDENGDTIGFPSHVESGLFAGYDVIVDATNVLEYFKQMGACSEANPAGPSTGVIINPWFENKTASVTFRMPAAS